MYHATSFTSFPPSVPLTLASTFTLLLLPWPTHVQLCLLSNYACYPIARIIQLCLSSDCALTPAGVIVIASGNDVFGIKSCCINIGCLSKPNENVAELDLEAKGDTPPTTLEDEVCTHAKNPVLEAKGDTPPTALEDEICTRARNPVREVTPLHSPPPSPPSKHPPIPQVAAAQGATVTPEMLLGSSAESP